MTTNAHQQKQHEYSKLLLGDCISYWDYETQSTRDGAIVAVHKGYYSVRDYGNDKVHPVGIVYFIRKGAK